MNKVVVIAEYKEKEDGGVFGMNTFLLQLNPSEHGYDVLLFQSMDRRYLPPGIPEGTGSVGLNSSKGEHKAWKEYIAKNKVNPPQLIEGVIEVYLG